MINSTHFIKQVTSFISLQLKPLTKLALALSVFLCIIISPADAQNWSWARSASGSAADQSRNVVADSWGNIYVTGFFASPALTIGSTSLTNMGGNDLFLIKYDSSGTIIWVKSAGGSGSEGPGGIAIDPVGNIYVTGVSNSPSLTFGTTTLPNAGSADLFVVKYDSSGNVIWAKSAGGTLTDEPYSIFTDVYGAVYLTGHYYSSSLQFGNTTLTSAGSSDAFFAKYDSSGTVLWAKSIGGSSGERGWVLSGNNNGDVFLAGTFYSTSITIGSTTLVNLYGDDIFLVKYDTAGTALWAKAAAGNLADNPRGLSADPWGNVYLAGWYNGSSIGFGSTTLQSAGGLDAFIAKYNSTGNVIWARTVGSPGFEVLNGLTTDGGGNPALIGYFEGSSVTVGGITLINSGPNTTGDIMAVKYDSAGTVLWAKSAGGAGVDLGYGISSDPAGNLYFTGNFESASCAFGSSTLNNTGASDVFVAKIHAISTGVNHLQSIENSVMYPNPASDKITIVGYKNNPNGKLTISDMTGKTVFFINSIQDKMEINIGDLPAGVYSVRIQTEEYGDTMKLIVAE